VDSNVVDISKAKLDKLMNEITYIGGNAMYYILDENENPVPASLKQWAEMCEDFNKRIIANDYIDETRVSTVFLGLDHSFMSGAPIVFESMIFNHPIFEEEQYRYSTIKEARKNHKALLFKVKRSLVLLTPDMNWRRAKKWVQKNHPEWLWDWRQNDGRKYYSRRHRTYLQQLGQHRRDRDKFFKRLKK